MSEKKAGEIRLIQLNSYVRPKLDENKSRDWVMNGQKNIFYQYVIDRFNGSPTNSAIINTYIDLIYGKGITSDNKEALNALDEATNDSEVRKIVSDFQLFGSANIQIIPKKNKKNLPEIRHIAKNKIIPQIEDEEGNINGYWFSKDWSRSNKKENKPEYFPAFGLSETSEITIHEIKPYKAGKEYFSDPDYMAGLPYAEMEEEIANYCINHIKNGLSFGYIINVPDGANWSEKERRKFEHEIKNKLTGSNNSGKFLIAFNGRDMEVNVVPLDVNSAHKQWEFLTKESRQQLFTAHRVISAALFGVKENTGLGNNANELDTAEVQQYKRVVRPKQKYITDAFSAIFNFYGFEYDFYFIPNTEVPADVNKSFDAGQIASATNIISSVNNGLLTEEQGKSILSSMLSYPQDEIDNIFKKKPKEVVRDDIDSEVKTELKKFGCGCDSVILNETPLQKVIDDTADEFIMSGENEGDLMHEFELICEDKEAFNIKEGQLNNIIELARTPFSTPKKKSEQDTSLFKVRYQYAGTKTGEREFCRKVLKENRVYRWEDLESASKKVVNKGMGLKGANTYDIAKYKGGVYCKHFWQRKIYLRRNNKKIGVNEARRLINQLPPSERSDAKWVQNPKEVAEIASSGNNYWKA